MPYAHPLRQAAREAQRGLAAPLPCASPPFECTCTILPACVLTERFLPPPEGQEQECCCLEQRPPPQLSLNQQPFCK